MGFDEERSRKRHSHPPSTTHVLGGFGHHRRSESQTVQNAARFRFESARVQFFELLVFLFDKLVVDVVGHAEVFDLLLESGNFFSGGCNDEVESVDICGVRFTTDEVNLRKSGNILGLPFRGRIARYTHIDVFRDGNVSVGHGFQECRLYVL